MEYYYGTLITLLTLFCAWIKYEQRKGSKKSELDETGISDKIRSSAIVQITAYTLKWLKDKKNYIINSESAMKNSLRNRVDLQISDANPNTYIVYYIKNRKKPRELMFSVTVTTFRHLWRYYPRIEYFVKSKKVEIK
jgi:hypothetical protein